MKHTIHTKLESGFSLMELTISMLILIPIMAAAAGMISSGANQQAAEQTSIDANQDARSALDIMTREIAQAGSHRDCSTVTTATVNPGEPSVSVNSTEGFSVGDWMEIGTGTSSESIQITAVYSNSLHGVFGTQHDSGSPVRLYALPFLRGVIPPTGLGASSSTTVPRLRFFGDINGDVSTNPALQYVEYAYDSANNQITRSMTPLTQSTKNPAVPFIRNVTNNSVHFTVNTNELGVITSANVALTVHNTWHTGSKYQETQLSSRVLIPSAIASTALVHEANQWGGINRLPSTPAHVTTWASSE